MVVTDDDAHLFVLERSGEVVGLFSPDDPLQPARLAFFSPYPQASITPTWRAGSPPCRAAGRRIASTARCGTFAAPRASRRAPMGGICT